jgi:phospho-N-acetylmuramoyl-pentapeptide-transferase
MGETTYQVIRILTIAASTFAVAMALTPLWTKFLYSYKIGKQIRTKGVPVFSKFHRDKEGTPTMGGVLIWASLLIVLILFALIKKLAPEAALADFYFLSRAETLLPLAALILAALIGLVDDVLGVLRIGPNGGGIHMRHRLLIYTALAVLGAWWFYFKLDWDTLAIPFFGDLVVGAWYIPIFIFIIVATAFSVNETDGLDGLSGGISLVAFASLGVIAFTQGRFDLAVLCAAIAGGIVAFLWFNIFPARFFMGDTGSMSLGFAMGITAMLINAGLLLPFIAFIPMIESISVLLQISSKKLRGKKLFLSTPIHHHFQARGWPETKVTERFWIIGGVVAVFGILIYLIGS